MARRLLLALTAAALCAAPATAHADVSEFGSDLSSPANISFNHGADTSYWNIGAGTHVAEAEGQITEVKLKGGVIPNPRLRGTEEEKLAQIIHFQVLRNRPDGTLKVVNLSTGHLKIPVTADESEVTTYRPVNLCVKKGDIVAFNTIGAHEYRDPNAADGQQGARYQVFGRVPDAITWWYEKDNGLNEGATIDPGPFPPMAAAELLMRTTLATGPDATDICPGGYAQHVFRGTDINPPPKVSPIPVRTRDNVARIRVFCHFENYGGCVGNLILRLGETELGRKRFDLKNGHTVMIEVPLSQATVNAIQAAKAQRVTAVTESTDKPGSDKRNTGAPGHRPGPQAKTITEELTLKPDKAPCIVPKKLVGMRSAAAKGSIRKAGCKTVVKYQKVKKASQSGKVLSHTPAAGTVLPSGAAVTIAVGRR